MQGIVCLMCCVHESEVLHNSTMTARITNLYLTHALHIRNIQNVHTCIRTYVSECHVEHNAQYIQTYSTLSPYTHATSNIRTHMYMHVCIIMYRTHSTVHTRALHSLLPYIHMQHPTVCTHMHVCVTKSGRTHSTVYTSVLLSLTLHVVPTVAEMKAP